MPAAPARSVSPSEARRVDGPGRVGADQPSRPRGRSRSREGSPRLAFPHVGVGHEGDPAFQRDRRDRFYEWAQERRAIRTAPRRNPRFRSEGGPRRSSAQRREGTVESDGAARSASRLDLRTVDPFDRVIPRCRAPVGGNDARDLVLVRSHLVPACRDLRRSLRSGRDGSVAAVLRRAPSRVRSARREARDLIPTRTGLQHPNPRGPVAFRLRQPVRGRRGSDLGFGLHGRSPRPRVPNVRRELRLRSPGIVAELGERARGPRGRRRSGHHRRPGRNAALGGAGMSDRGEHEFSDHGDASTSSRNQPTRDDRADALAPVRLPRPAARFSAHRRADGRARPIRKMWSRHGRRTMGFSTVRTARTDRVPSPFRMRASHGAQPTAARGPRSGSGHRNRSGQGGARQAVGRRPCGERSRGGSP